MKMERMRAHQGYWIVVWDPAGEYDEGSIVDTKVCDALRSRGTVMLPIEPELLTTSAVGGYMRRAWGAGYPLFGHPPRLHCPLIVGIGPDYHQIHWVARLTGEDTRRANRPVEEHDGYVNFVPHSDQVGALNAAFPGSEETQVSIPLIGPRDEHDGWTIGGTTSIHIMMQGLLGVGLFGYSPQMRVLWAAVSVTR